MIKVAPSILSADFAYLADEIKKIETAGAEIGRASCRERV